MTGVRPIEPGEVLLHVGLHKTGTTALQSALADARTDLAVHDVRYPGTSQFQHAAVLAGLGRTSGWQQGPAEEVPTHKWDALVAESKHPGRTVISSEFLDDVDAAQAAQVIDQLGGPERVRVVVTLRSIGAILPSAWQQRLKAGYAGSFKRFLEMVFPAQPSERSERFWFRHDQVAQVKRWAGVVGADRTYAVIIPDGDRRAIYTAFEQLLALPDGMLADREIPVGNRSMTAQEAQFVRLLNREVADELDWADYNRTVRRGLVLNMVEQRVPGPDEPRIQTPDWAADRAAEFGQRFADGIAASGVNVIGDPQALARRPRSGKNPPAEDLPMGAAVAGAAGLVRSARRSSVEPTRAQALRILLRRPQLGRGKD